MNSEENIINNEENISGIPTDPETGEVLWSDKDLAWFKKWETADDTGPRTSRLSVDRYRRS